MGDRFMSSIRITRVTLFSIFACVVALGCRKATTVDDRLVLAAGLGDVRQMKELISKGADINHRSSARGHTPLTFAVEEGNAAAVGFLLGAGADPNLCDDRGFSPLRLALTDSAESALRIIECLVQSGADTDAVTNVVAQLPRNNPNREAFEEALRHLRRGMGHK